MAEKLLIDAHYKDETRIAVINEDGSLENFEAEHSQKKPIKGNIYLAKIVRIEPSIQAAFIDYGAEKHGFLPLTEIHPDYYNKDILEADDEKNNDDEADETSEIVDNSENNEGAENAENQVVAPIKKKKIFKIQDVLSYKQIVLVQAEKEVRGNKCASFSTYISLPGRYCVLTPTNSVNGRSSGISKKIEASEKERLREVVSSLEIPEGMGCIIRTAGENRTKQEIKRDFEYLLRLWDGIKEKMTSSVAPVMVHEEGNIIKRTIRDLYKRTTERIIVQGMDAYKEARTFMRIFTPSHVKKIELYDEAEVPIFHKYGVDDKISGILNPTVVLPSGGTIVINPTEALTAIDVNSAKMRKERGLEDTALKTNLEAAVEIARQIKLRDIAGIIVIDFIDMVEYSSVGKVEKKFKEAVKDDYSSIQIGKISQFGLMEISRQRLRASLADSNFVQCQHCYGSGKILSNETVALFVIRKIENFLVNEKAKSIIVEVANGVDLFVLNYKRRLLLEMEENFNVSIEIARNPAIKALECKIIITEHADIFIAPAAISKEPESAVQKPEAAAPTKENQQKIPQKKKFVKKNRDNSLNETKARIAENIVILSEKDEGLEPVTTVTQQSPKQQRQKRSFANNMKKKESAANVESVNVMEKLVNKTNFKAQNIDRHISQPNKLHSQPSASAVEKITNKVQDSSEFSKDVADQQETVVKKKRRRRKPYKKPEDQGQETAANTPQEVVVNTKSISESADNSIVGVTSNKQAGKRLREKSNDQDTEKKSGWLKKMFS